MYVGVDMYINATDTDTSLSVVCRKQPLPFMCVSYHIIVDTLIYSSIYRNMRPDGGNPPKRRLGQNRFFVFHKSVRKILSQFLSLL